MAVRQTRIPVIIAVVCVVGAAGAQALSVRILDHRWTVLNRPLTGQPISETVDIEVPGQYSVIVGFRESTVVTEAFDQLGLSGGWRVFSARSIERIAAGNVRTALHSRGRPAGRHGIGEFEATEGERIKLELEIDVHEQVLRAEPYVEVTYKPSAYARHYRNAMLANLLAVVLAGAAVTALVIAGALALWHRPVPT